MRNTIFSILLILAIILSFFTGCRAQTTEQNPGESELISETAAPEATVPETDAPEEETTADASEPEQPIPAPSLAFNSFDNGLIAYLNQTRLAEGNYAVSPLSFRAALALAAIGAEGETLDQLLQAMGYTDLEALRAWYKTVLDGVDLFDGYFESSRITDRGEAAYRIVNAVWNNEDLPGEFREAYIASAEADFRAAVKAAAADQLTDAINNWVNEQTEGLIPALVSDASDASAILVNALYLKAGWENSFGKIGPDVFTTAAGETVEKEYIRGLSNYAYYEDDTCQSVAVTLQGGMRMVFVLGEAENIAEKLAKAEYCRVEVTVPMFDVETSLDQHELLNYLKSLGCELPLDPDRAEFDPMFTEQLFIDDIIQKSKVSIDEEGLEAAAATAITMYGNTAVQNPPEPKIFRADRPFRFYVVDSAENPELLFYGQIVN